MSTDKILLKTEKAEKFGWLITQVEEIKKCATAKTVQGLVVRTRHIVERVCGDGTVYNMDYGIVNQGPRMFFDRPTRSRDKIEFYKKEFIKSIRG